MAEYDIDRLTSARNATKTRTCKACGIPAGVGRWYSGITTHCAECWKARQKIYYRATKPERQEYDRARAMLPHRVEIRQRYERTETGKAALRRAHLRGTARFPERRQARVVLGNAVRDGKIAKPKACERCSAGGRIHGHHADYSKPLEVEWLCAGCHTAEHRGADE